ncbi:MAG: tetratricopeptide repeat protein [Flavobacteriia bacterium]|nr:tetratricopeptide repeat protein [Flavobacteriia bacterium]
MATYNKRGYKGKNVEEVQQLENENSTTAEVFSSLDESASKTEAWVASNQSYILGVIGVIAIGVLGYLGYIQFVQKPQEATAANELFYPQQYFDQAVNATQAKDSLFLLALNGAEGKYGLLDIANEYAGTKAANLAHYSAGVSYLNLQKYPEAIDQLEQFSSQDAILGALAKGNIGDAFMQLDQLKEALSYYEKAIAHSSNEFTTPKFLQKAAIAAIALGDNDKAASFLARIKSDFPNATEAQSVDAQLGLVNADK